MGWFSDIFTIETLAPIAAGALTGGAGYGLLAASAAGAGTGAGIAALKGDDILAGAVGGGLGGMTGGSLSSAFNPASAGSGIAKAATQGAAPVGGLTSGQVAAAGGRSGMDLTANTFGQGLILCTSQQCNAASIYQQAGREAIAQVHQAFKRKLQQAHLVLDLNKVYKILVVENSYTCGCR